MRYHATVACVVINRCPQSIVVRRQEPRGDFIDRLKKILDERLLSEDETYAQGIGFFLAGFETTSNTLSTFTYHLAKNQDIQVTSSEHSGTQVRSGGRPRTLTTRTKTAGCGIRLVRATLTVDQGRGSHFPSVISGFRLHVEVSPFGSPPTTEQPFGPDNRTSYGSTWNQMTWSKIPSQIIPVQRTRWSHVCS